jgi:hypothetical protein
MRQWVGFHNRTLGLELDSERYLGTWQGPEPLTPSALRDAIAAAVDSPLEAPPLQESVVPGDRIAIAVDLALPGWDTLARSAVGSMRSAGIKSEDIAILAKGGPGPDPSVQTLDGIPVQVHDPTDRAGLAYLASTSRDRRIYLNRGLVDADFVLPIGRLQYGRAGRIVGPWSLIFPDLSDLATHADLRKQSLGAHRSSRLSGDEAIEVCWLLGNLFQIGAIEGHQGIASVIGGLAPAVQRAGIEALRSGWLFHADERVDLVVAGIGPQGRVTCWDDLTAALETAARLVKSGGSVVLIADLDRRPGPALEVLSSSRSPEEAHARLREIADAEDMHLARALLRCSGQMSLFCHGIWDAGLVEELGMVLIENPTEIERLARARGTTLVLSHADQMRVELVDENS